MMTNVLIVGSNKHTDKLIQFLLQMKEMKIVAIVNNKANLHINNLAQTFKVKVVHHWNELQKEHVDYIVLMEENNELISQLQNVYTHAQIIQNEFFLPFYNEISIMEQKYKEQDNELTYLHLLFNNIRDGFIVIDRNENIQFINEAAKKIIGITHLNINGEHIKKYIKNSRLPNVLRTQQKEVNQPFILNNNKQIVTTRIPLINQENRLIGAFAIFKENDGIIRLAEENTDLKEVKTMLEAIIQSSNEAIIVVDE